MIHREPKEVLKEFLAKKKEKITKLSKDQN